MHGIFALGIVCTDKEDRNVCKCLCVFDKRRGKSDVFFFIIWKDISPFFCHL